MKSNVSNPDSNSSQRFKLAAAQKAITLIEDGMVVGLGTGSTTRYAIEQLAHRLHHGDLDDIQAVATSTATAHQAQVLGIPLIELVDHPDLDLAIDGADEIDPQFNLIKGLGGALVREKLVELHARRLIIIADESKLVTSLGTRGPLPVEVAQFAWQVQAAWLAETLSCRVERREHANQPFISDNHNFILHCHFENGISDPWFVQDALANRPGLVGHGLFLKMAHEVIVAGKAGVQHLRR